MPLWVFWNDLGASIVNCVAGQPGCAQSVQTRLPRAASQSWACGQSQGRMTGFGSPASPTTPGCGLSACTSTPHQALATREARCIPHSPQGTPALLSPASPPRGTACSAPVHPPPGRMKPGHALLRCFASWVLPRRRSWVGLCHAPVCACASTSARVSSRRWVMVTTPYSFAS